MSESSAITTPAPRMKQLQRTSRVFLLVHHTSGFLFSTLRPGIFTSTSEYRDLDTVFDSSTLKVTGVYFKNSTR
jgi:hypothetical protein